MSIDLLTVIIASTGAVLATSLIEFIKWLVRKMSKKNTVSQQLEELLEESKNLREGLLNCTEENRAVLYDRIEYLAKSYIRAEQIGAKEKSNLKLLHSIYHDKLDGNGHLDEIMAMVEKIDTVLKQ